MKIVIIGLGIGEVHLEQAKRLGFNTITVDSNSLRNPTYINVEELIKNESELDASIIATPNFTHMEFIEKLAPISKLLIVEKPGLNNSTEWRNILNKFPNTRIVMAKNNMFREDMGICKDEYRKSRKINIVWLNKNRVPFPGGWFTNKQSSWGGVSYDLMPHLIHIAIYMAGFDRINSPISRNSFQKWQINDVQETEYGSVNKIDPVYNVDDHCRINFEINGKQINCAASWQTNNFTTWLVTRTDEHGNTVIVKNNLKKDEAKILCEELTNKGHKQFYEIEPQIKECLTSDLREIQFLRGDRAVLFELGLCPNSAYGKQLEFFLNMSDSEYKIQNDIDLFTLQCIENIKEDNPINFWEDIEK